MTDEKIAEEQGKGSWLFFSSEPCVGCAIVPITPICLGSKGAAPAVAGTRTFTEFLTREKGGCQGHILLISSEKLVARMIHSVFLLHYL